MRGRGGILPRLDWNAGHPGDGESISLPCHSRLQLVVEIHGTAAIPRAHVYVLAAELAMVGNLTER